MKKRFTVHPRARLHAAIATACTSRTARLFATASVAQSSNPGVAVDDVPVPRRHLEAHGARAACVTVHDLARQAFAIDLVIAQADGRGLAEHDVGDRRALVGRDDRP